MRPSYVCRYRDGPCKAVPDGAMERQPLALILADRPLVRADVGLVIPFSPPFISAERAISVLPLGAIFVEFTAHNLKISEATRGSTLG